MKAPIVRTAFTAVILVLSASLAGPTRAAAPNAAPRNELFYLVFVRSFRDSNGDGVGDLRGIEEKLGYLQDLGVTTLVLTPLYASPYYHNYFADSFSRIDPAYGSESDFRSLVRALHRRGMQIFIDQEIQYITANHEWFRDSLNNPKSPYSHFMLYDGPANTQPFSLELPSYDGTKTRVAMANMHEPAVLQYQEDLFAHWMNPTGRPGDDEGVDGFRIDHMMDDLDNLKRLDHLFSGFWAPLFAKLRAENPRIRILAEQADWGSYGEEWFSRGDVDMVYDFHLRFAIVSFDKKQIEEAVTQTALRTPPGKQQLIFVENHDTNRFATEVNGDPRRERVGATLNLLLKGIPLLYYGQELGVQGRQLKDTGTDGNDIPVREAFPWTAKVGPGMAVWYKGTGPWWSGSLIAKGGYPSLEAESGDPASLLSFYKRLAALRRANPELVDGEQAIVENDSPGVFSFVRFGRTGRILVAVNLTDQPITTRFDPKSLLGQPGSATLRDLGTGNVPTRGPDGACSVTLTGYGTGIFEVTSPR